MHDQADELRQLVRLVRNPRAGWWARHPRWIVVAGGRSNVGCTTLAVNLAVALAGQGQQIVLVDADLERSGVASLCNVAERLSIVDVLKRAALDSRSAAARPGRNPNCSRYLGAGRCCSDIGSGSPRAWNQN